MTSTAKNGATYGLYSDLDCKGWTTGFSQEMAGGDVQNGCLMDGVLANLMGSWSLDVNTAEPPRSILIQDGILTIGEPSSTQVTTGQCYNFDPTVRAYMRGIFTGPGSSSEDGTRMFASLCGDKSPEPPVLNHKPYPKIPAELRAFDGANCTGADFSFQGQYASSCDGRVLPTVMLRYSMARNTTKPFLSLKVGDTSTLLLNDGNWSRPWRGDCYTLTDQEVSELTKATTDIGVIDTKAAVTSATLCPIGGRFFHTDNITAADLGNGTASSNPPSSTHSSAGHAVAPAAHLALFLCLIMVLQKHVGW
ncbi:hypothetical protein RI367_006766 [Sorochytrium milnesiophthora]